MSKQNKKRSNKRKNGFVISMSVVILAGIAYVFLPEEQKDDLLDSVGLSDETEEVAFKDFVEVRNLTSRKALIGGDWIIKGQLFNVHPDRAVKKVKLLFNFDDGVEAIWLNETISAQNKTGRKFKERVSGHSEAQFIDVDVIAAE